MKQYKKIVWHQIVVPQLGSSWQHNYSTKTRQASWANEWSMYYLMSMGRTKHYSILCPFVSYEEMKCGEKVFLCHCGSWPYSQHIIFFVTY
jgi:hypothetical protein